MCPNSIFHVHADTLCNKRADKCQYSEDEPLTKHKHVAIQHGDTEKPCKSSRKEQKIEGGGVAVYVLYMCVSQDTLCAVSSWIKHITKDSNYKTEAKRPRHTQA